MPSNLTLDESLAWISNNAVEGGAYTITLKNHETIAPKTLFYSGKTVSITLEGGSTEWTVSLSSTGSLFTVESGVTLTLGANLTLEGRNDNTDSLVRVNNGGMLAMHTGSKLRSNTSSYGGGVYVDGTFTMEGGEISGNTASSSFFSSSYGGGVYISSVGTFTMSGGEISGNTASSGGGVYISYGMFTKQTGAVIYGSNAEDTLKNTATNGDSYGHAVYVEGSPAKIRNTTAGFSVTLDSASDAAGGWEAPPAVQITLQPVLGDPPISDTSLFVYESASFSAGDGHTSYAWYWDGEGISGASSSTYTLEAYSRPSGIYELSVVVTTSTGERRSARCRVVIKAEVVNSGIGNIWYSSVSGGEWTLQGDGSRRSPSIGHNGVTKARINFTSGSSNASITIQLRVSSESGCDFAFISQLDDDSATDSGSVISGETSVTVTIPVSSAGSHFVDIGYRKDSSQISGSDCAWFRVIE
jgi:hypothetical protein